MKFQTVLYLKVLASSLQKEIQTNSLILERYFDCFSFNFEEVRVAVNEATLLEKKLRLR